MVYTEEVKGRHEEEGSSKHSKGGKKWVAECILFIWKGSLKS